MNIFTKKIKHKYITAGIALSFSVALFYNVNDVMAYSVQGPVGHSGSPADGKNCSFCHSGNEQPITTGFTSDIPVEGYTPGQNYTVTVGGAEVDASGGSRFGFQMSAQDNQGTTLGTFTAGTGSIVGNPGHYPTHLSAVSTTTPSWTYEWTAPAIGTGDVIFSLAVVSANGNGNTGGDKVLTNSKTITELVTTSVQNLNSAVNAYVDLSNNLNVSIRERGQFTFTLTGINGQIYQTQSINFNESPGVLKIPLNSSLKKGVYVVNLQNADIQVRSKVVL